MKLPKPRTRDRYSGCGHENRFIVLKQTLQFALSATSDLFEPADAATNDRKHVIRLSLKPASIDE
jgi:hypothetical protein